MVALWQADGDCRRSRRDERRRSGLDGPPWGASGAEGQALAAAWLVGAAVAGASCVLNVLTRVHDRPQEGLLLPALLEASSFATILVAFFVPAAVASWIRRAQPSRWRMAVVVAAGAPAYFIIHVGGFVAIRAVTLPLLITGGRPAAWFAHELPYEFAKDVLAYLLSLLIMGAAQRWRTGQAQVAAAPAASFDIRDGARLVRAPLGDILAIRSAGNYVEFLLRDGRRPLMRTPLGALEQELAGQGFVRTHRSWLVNAARVSGLRPEGSGDFAVELGEVEAPLSRRFPSALAALRR